MRYVRIIHMDPEVLWDLGLKEDWDRPGRGWFRISAAGISYWAKP